MPSRNTLRNDLPTTYYHVYIRGNSKRQIFLVSSDKIYFVNLFARYLSKQQATSKTGQPYPNYFGSIELLAYCLMDNHVHFLFYQSEKGSVAKFMKSLLTSYCRYFNLKYKQSGTIFESRYKAAMITNDSYLLQISRYIHLNPRSWKRYKYSSIEYYRRGREPEWLITSKVLDLHESRNTYIQFLRDYEERKYMLNEIKHELADQ